MGSYIPSTREERQEMLAAAGYDSIRSLFKDVPAEVYLDKHDKIYADGIDDDTGEKRREFYIYPEHYSDVLFFIGHVLNLV